MSDLKSRIKALEKKVIPPPIHDLSNTMIWVEKGSDGKQYYTKEGIKHEYHEGDFDKNTLIVTYIGQTPTQEANK